jgi:predicted nucleic acid-binding protein
VIHLDTNFLILALLPGSPEDEQLRAWVRAQRPVGISAISWAKFLYGPVSENDVETASHVLREPVPFVAADATLAARLFETGGRRRGTLADCMIAATAIRSAAELASANLGDFRRFRSAGLKLVTGR